MGMVGIFKLVNKTGDKSGLATTAETSNANTQVFIQAARDPFTGLLIYSINGFIEPQAEFFNL